MSYTSWHTYGYGICVSDIKEASLERFQKLLLGSLGVPTLQFCAPIKVCADKVQC